jgi:4-hydroxy-tetrahydrodipicolinate reductase
MHIALIGYGKMGREIEQIALQRGHSVTCKISSANQYDLNPKVLQWADIAIEFSKPEVAFENVMKCMEYNLPVVCGTTGWNKERAEAEKHCSAMNGSFLYASNFSIGVNIFFEINRRLAGLMNKYESYDISIEEAHHVAKIDKPSGTAISLAQDIISEIDRKNVWTISENHSNPKAIPIHSIRKDQIPGTHTIKYASEIDDITITHTAHNRKGFALGAILAAEWLLGKRGVYTMQDVLAL